MNLILEHTKQVPYFTEMGSVLRALSVSVPDYDWYLSDIETNCRVPGLSAEDQWITGEDLDRLLTDHEIQFIWAVFSAVPKGGRFNVTNSPYADGNSSYWRDAECKPQLAGALFEIVCFDSSATILVGISAEMAANFTRVYSDAKPLAATH